MKPRTILLLVLALICAASAAVGVNQLVRQAHSTEAVKTVAILIAAHDIPRGAVLSEKMLQAKAWPADLAPTGVFQESEKVLRRVALAPIAKGEPILDLKLSGKVGGPGLAAMIPSGMRAFTIRTPHVAAGVGGFVLPGNRVDVLLTTQSSGRDDASGGGATTTLLQNVQVLAVDEHLDPKYATDALDRKDLKSVTLLVTPNQANKLDLGMNLGSLHLALRNPDDNAEGNARPATLADLRFHKEQPQPSDNVLRGMFAAMREAWASQPLEKAAPAAAAAPAPPQTAHIRTLRGSHRSYVRLETGR